MVIIQIAGGLGNQMHQYALYRKLRKLGHNCKLDISWFESDRIQKKVLTKRKLELTRFENLPMEICTESEKQQVYGSDDFLGRLKRKLFRRPTHFVESEMYHPELFNISDGYLRGYFACDKYYADIMPQIRRDFIFPVSADAKVEQKNLTIRGIMQSDPYSVCIHIRRGDYLAPENVELLGGICTPEYYAGAVEEVRRRFYETSGEGKLTFYIFSDDPAYAKTLHFGKEDEENVVIDWNTGEDNLLDMGLMRHGRAMICANSTFSFWGARLSFRTDKLMVRPFYHRNNQTTDPETMHDYWKDWILADKDGSVY